MSTYMNDHDINLNLLKFIFYSSEDLCKSYSKIQRFFRNFKKENPGKYKVSDCILNVQVAIAKIAAVCIYANSWKIIEFLVIHREKLDQQQENLISKIEENTIQDHSFELIELLIKTITFNLERNVVFI